MKKKAAKKNRAFKQLSLRLPTYNGTLFHEEVFNEEMAEYGAPRVPVSISYDLGLRVILGASDEKEIDRKPDLLIEKHPNGWAIFIHPAGSDPSCAIYLLPGARTVIVPELDSSLEVTAPLADVPEIDGISSDKAYEESEERLQALSDEQLVSALKGIKDILWPRGDPDKQWTASEIEEVAEVLERAGLRPSQQQGLLPAVLLSPAEK